MKPLGDAFIKLVKMIIAPVIFLTVVTGIAGMRQRVAALGGRLQIDGRPGRTCLEAFVPVQGRPA